VALPGAAYNLVKFADGALLVSGPQFGRKLGHLTAKVCQVIDQVAINHQFKVLRGPSFILCHDPQNELPKFTCYATDA
jgi:hypothetical protein